MTTLNNLSKLLESDLEQARLIFATNDVVDRLQSMAEQIAKMSVNDVMPIVDDMRGTFGPEKADTFEAAVNEALDAALEAIKSSKDKVANEVLRLEGKAAPESTGPSDLENDAMAAAEPSEEGSEGEEAGGLDAEGTEGSDDTEEELDDIFGDSGDEGVGRAKKESARVNTKKARIMEAKRALRKKIAETARKLQALKESEQELKVGGKVKIRDEKHSYCGKTVTIKKIVGDTVYVGGDNLKTMPISKNKLENQAIKEAKLSGKAKEEFLARMGKAPKKDTKPADKECKKDDKDCKEEVDEASRFGKTIKNGVEQEKFLANRVNPTLKGAKRTKQEPEEKEIDEGKIPAGLKAYQDKKAGKKPAKPCKK